MELIGYPDTDYTIIGIMQYTSYIIKYSAVYDMRDSLHMPMGEVTISMLYVIRLCILKYAPPKYVLHWNIYIYIFW